MAKVDLVELNKRVEQKLINVQKHPDAELYIYNYTPIAQFKRQWDEYTLMSRGLILDVEGNIVARPFTKFFNYQEYQGEDSKLPKLPLEGYRVLEKMDGSLGILYKVNGKPYLATRGSFTSDQALAGTAILRERYDDFEFEDGFTYLFEIIYPQNRIVVDYKGVVDIVLLAVLDTETGNSEKFAKTTDFPFPVVQTYPMQPLDKLLATQRDNAEGFVLQYLPSQVRIKIKHDDYVRLHRLLTGVSSKTIWELLKNNQTLDDILDNIPDEFYDWVMKVHAELIAKFSAIKDEAMTDLSLVPQSMSRKVQAMYINANFEYPYLIFGLLDGKPIDEAVWKLIKPKYEQPFRKDIDA